MCDKFTALPLLFQAAYALASAPPPPLGAATAAESPAAESVIAVGSRSIRIRYLVLVSIAYKFEPRGVPF